MIKNVLNKKRDQGEKMLLVRPIWKYQNWYLILLKMSIKKTNTFTPISAISHEPTETISFTTEKQNFKMSGVGSFREKLVKEGHFRDSFPTYFK